MLHYYATTIPLPQTVEIATCCIKKISTWSPLQNIYTSSDNYEDNGMSNGLQKMKYMNNVVPLCFVSNLDPERFQEEGRVGDRCSYKTLIKCFKQSFPIIF